MTAVRDRAALGLGTELDPDRIDITRHALMRYLERRGQSATVANFAHADAKLRDLLSRVPCGSTPPVECRAGETPARRYMAGGFTFIVAADHSTLITFYEAKRSGPKKPKRYGRRHG